MTEPKPDYDTLKMSDLERTFWGYWSMLGNGQTPMHEYQFHYERRWRFDWAFPLNRVAIECEGGIWTGGRHTRGGGFESDCEKYNAAIALGWMVFRVTTGLLERDPYAFCEMVKDAIEGRPI